MHPTKSSTVQKVWILKYLILWIHARLFSLRALSAENVLLYVTDLFLLTIIWCP